MESAWLMASTLGFLLDVFVYHTFSLLMKSVMKLRTCSVPRRAHCLRVCGCAVLAFIRCSRSLVGGWVLVGSWPPTPHPPALATM
jgi:hypothetical protein